MLKVVTLLSTLRDPTQLRRRQWATRQQNTFFLCTLLSSLDHLKKSFLVGEKVSTWFREFRTCFWKVDHPYVVFENKKTQILIEFLDGTKKVQLAGKKSFLVGKKSSAMV